MFAALVPPVEAVEDLESFLEVRRASADFRWTRPEQFHVTLAFMAEVSEWRVDGYLERLVDSLGAVRAPQVRLARAVAFPGPAAAKVLAVGAEAELDQDAAALRSLAAKTRNAAVSAGIEVDGTTFRPHVTVARLGHPQDVTNWFRLLETYDGPSWSADRVTVFASHLGEGPRKTPRHEVIAEVTLG